MTSHPTLTRPPRRFQTGVTNFDPLHRLACAVIMQAALDFFWPRRHDSAHVHYDAERFLTSAEGRDLLRAVGISEQAVAETLDG